MGKTGRRGKSDDREPKDARLSLNITAAQRKKLRWLAEHLQISIADLIGQWIETVFNGMGGNLNANPEPMPKEPEIECKTFGRLVMLHFDQLTQSGKFHNGRLKELMGGMQPTDLETVRIALICGVSEDYVRNLPVVVEENGSATNARVD